MRLRLSARGVQKLDVLTAERVARDLVLSDAGKGDGVAKSTFQHAEGSVSLVGQGPEDCASIIFGFCKVRSSMN